jgi:DNA-binding NarL/FixJ family response regulator
METEIPPKIKLLVVEDDVHVATVLEARLQTFGYEVCPIVRSGRVAVRSAIEHRPDLVLMDILLEGSMNGIEAADLISRQMDVPIVFITCLSDRHMLEQALKAKSVHGYILKPYDNAELRYTLQIALIKHRAHKERETLIEELTRNVSDRKQAEEALQLLNQTLEQQVSKRTEAAEHMAGQLRRLTAELIETEERERRQFAQLLHDDLQQMLASAKMQVQAAAEKWPPEPLLANAGHLLEQAIAQSRRLSHDLSPAVLHQSGLVAALSWLAGQMREQFDLKVDLEATDIVLESSPATVFLFRATQELLFNVVKHAGVKIACVFLSIANGSLELKVTDPGRGFDAERLHRSVDKAGLGLLTIRERAGYMGGGFSVESAPDKGSRFTLTIPIDLKGNQKSEAGLKMAAGAGVIRVLFADDHELMRKGLVQLICNQPGLQVVGEASNGRQALDRARQLKPDVVVMDVSMPVMDGFEATRQIKTEMPDIRIVGLSMFDDENIANNMRKAGAESFVCKTASTSELLKAISLPNGR